MSDLRLRSVIKGAALGGIVGGIVIWLLGLLLLALQPIVFMTAGIYAGIAVGGMIGALEADRQQAKLEFAMARRR